MKDCVGTYAYKGFLINFSEYYQRWCLEPTFLGSSDDAINFAVEYNNDCEGFKTISQAKKYINANEKDLVDSVHSGYKEYCEKYGNK